MGDVKVERLKINYKTLEEFQKFREYGLEELSMLDDLRQNIIENDSDSPFYGIYADNQLIARMSSTALTASTTGISILPKTISNCGNWKCCRNIAIKTMEPHWSTTPKTWGSPSRRIPAAVRTNSG